MDKNNFIRYNIFQPFENLLAFTTTKKSFELHSPRFTGDSEQVFQKNRKELALALKIELQNLIFPRQTHTNCVIEINKIPTEEIKETDALLSNKSGICLCVQTADCVPILLFDPINNVIAAVHAGWRGTVKKIVEIAVQKMIAIYRSKPENIIAAIGPSISPKIYEVGNEVVEEVKKSIPNFELTLHKNDSDKYHFNLWEANRQLLLHNGIQAKNIEVLAECSFQEKEKYFSARREGIDTGRTVTGIMLRF